MMKKLTLLFILLSSTLFAQRKIDLIDQSTIYGATGTYIISGSGTTIDTIKPAGNDKYLISKAAAPGFEFVDMPSFSLSDGDYGDITLSSSGTVWTIDNDVVTYAKMQNVSATDRLLGRVSASSGDVEEVILDTDGTLTADSDDRVSTQKAVKTYVDANAGGDEYFTITLSQGNTSPADFTAVYYGWRYSQPGEGIKFNNPAVVPFDCIIVKADMSWRAATCGSSEVIDNYISVWSSAHPPVLQSDNIAIQTDFTCDAGTGTNNWASSGTLAISASAGQLIWAHYVGPWATNPVNITITMILTCKKQ